MTTYENIMNSSNIRLYIYVFLQLLDKGAASCQILYTLKDRTNIFFCTPGQDQDFIYSKANLKV